MQGRAHRILAFRTASPVGSNILSAAVKPAAVTRAVLTGLVSLPSTSLNSVPAASRAVPRLKSILSAFEPFSRDFSSSALKMAPIPTNGVVEVSVDWTGSDPAEAVKKFANGAEVAVFSKSWCPYCAKVKSLFGANHIREYVFWFPGGFHRGGTAIRRRWVGLDWNLEDRVHRLRRMTAVAIVEPRTRRPYTAINLVAAITWKFGQLPRFLLPIRHIKLTLSFQSPPGLPYSLPM